MGKSESRYISAGDLEKFSYCPLSWWLSRGFDSDALALEKGIQEHDKLGKSLWQIDSRERAARESETLVLWYAIVASLMAIIGVELLPIEWAEPLSWILGTIALIWVLAAAFFLYKASKSTLKSTLVIYERIILIFAIIAVVIAVSAVAFLVTDVRLAQTLELLSIAWLIAASFFLYRSLKATGIAESLRKEFRVQGKIEYIDLDDAKAFKSEKYGLIGRPDYVIKLGDKLIPVEEKKGRTPQGPLFSHILQVAAYCLLVEEADKKAPPYGLLKYPEQEHQIEYNADMKKVVLEKLAEMKKAAVSGDVHRNHNRPGKCRFCSRREVCPEKLA
jgi:CRISPR-associated exonuclease Cas4